MRPSHASPRHRKADLGHLDVDVLAVVPVASHPAEVVIDFRFLQMDNVFEEMYGRPSWRDEGRGLPSALDLKRSCVEDDDSFSCDLN